MGILCRNITVNVDNTNNSLLNGGGNGTVTSLGNQQLDMSGNWGWKNTLDYKTISQYDHLFKSTAKRLGLDWRLVAAHCFIESGINPNATNPKSSAKSMWQIIFWPQGYLPTTDPMLSTLAYESIMKDKLNECRNCITDNDRIAMALQKYHDGSSTKGVQWSTRTPGPYGKDNYALTYVPDIIKKYKEYCK